MVSRRKSIETLQKGTVLNTPQIVPGRNPRVNVPTVKASNVELNVFETAIPMAKMNADMGAAQALNGTLRTGPNLNSTSSKSPQSGHAAMMCDVTIRA
jgi:hypothetical protein